MKTEIQKVLQEMFHPTQQNPDLSRLVKEWAELSSLEEQGPCRATRHAFVNKKKRLQAFLTNCLKDGKLSHDQVKDLRGMLLREIDGQLHENNSSRVLKVGPKLEIYSSDQEIQPKVEEKEEVKQESMEDEENCKDFIQTNPDDNYNQSQQRKCKKKYLTFDPEFKEEVCSLAQQRGIQFAMKRYKLSARKISNWMEALSHNLLGKGRKALDPAMEFNISIWILKKIWNRVPLTQKIIRHKAASMSTLQKSFNGSKGWLEKFFLRHVQLKSCFDFRNKNSTREECARYHRCAFARVLKDSQAFSKLPKDFKHIIKGNLEDIIYHKGTHPILKLWNDKKLDTHRMGSEDLYNHEDLKNFTPVKLESKAQEYSELDGDGEGEFQDDCSSDDEISQFDDETSVKKQEQSEQDEVSYNLYEEADD